MPYPSNRQLNIFIVLSVIGLMAYGLYTEYVDGLIPCPLCMSQRFFFCALGTVALLAAIHNPGTRLRRIYASLIALFALGGIGTAGRQIWLQHLPPDQVPACGPSSLEYIFGTFAFTDALAVMLRGDGNCAEVDWTFLGFSMAEWAFVWFVFFLLAGVYQLIKRQP